MKHAKTNSRRQYCEYGASFVVQHTALFFVLRLVVASCSILVIKKGCECERDMSCGSRKKSYLVTHVMEYSKDLNVNTEIIYQV